jgi:hypothetical protein
VTTHATRLRVGLAFGLFEAAMPLLGLLLGHSLAGAPGHAAHWIGAAVLIATGLYGLIQALRHDGSDSGDAAGRGLGSCSPPGLRSALTTLPSDSLWARITSPCSSPPFSSAQSASRWLSSG